MSRSGWPVQAGPGRMVTLNVSCGRSRKRKLTFESTWTTNDGRGQLGCFLDDVYVDKRIHSSLCYLTPVEFEEYWQKERALALDLN